MSVGLGAGFKVNKGVIGITVKRGRIWLVRTVRLKIDKNTEALFDDAVEFFEWAYKPGDEIILDNSNKRGIFLVDFLKDNGYDPLVIADRGKVDEIRKEYNPMGSPLNETNECLALIHWYMKR